MEELMKRYNVCEIAILLDNDKYAEWCKKYRPIPNSWGTDWTAGYLNECRKHGNKCDLTELFRLERLQAHYRV